MIELIKKRWKLCQRSGLNKLNRGLTATLTLARGKLLTSTNTSRWVFVWGDFTETLHNRQKNSGLQNIKWQVISLTRRTRHNRKESKEKRFMSTAVMDLRIRWTNDTLLPVDTWYQQFHMCHRPTNNTRFLHPLLSLRLKIAFMNSHHLAWFSR